MRTGGEECGMMGGGKGWEIGMRSGGEGQME